MKESIQILKEKLEKYPAAKCKIEDDSIEVLAENDEGFSVTLYDCGDEIIVSYGGWHDHFRDQRKAIDCFIFGLSKQCRLKVGLRGSFEYIWTVQSLEHEEWYDVDSTSLLFFPFWRSKNIRYLQNKLWEGI